MFHGKRISRILTNDNDPFWVFVFSKENIEVPPVMTVVQETNSKSRTTRRTTIRLLRETHHGLP